MSKRRKHGRSVTAVKVNLQRARADAKRAARGHDPHAGIAVKAKRL